jgi:hypothetical protein
MAILWFRQLVTAFSQWRTDFNPRPVHVGFVVKKVAVGQTFLPVLKFSHKYHSTKTPYPFIHLPLMLHDLNN